jgi:hypothetical protein
MTYNVGDILLSPRTHRVYEVLNRKSETGMIVRLMRKDAKDNDYCQSPAEIGQILIIASGCNYTILQEESEEII